MRFTAAVVLVALALALLSATASAQRRNNTCTGAINTRRGAIQQFRVGDGQRFTCAMSEPEVAETGTPSVSHGAWRWYIGENLVDGSDTRGAYDPIVVAFRSGVQQWCNDKYERTSDEVVGYGLLFNDAADAFASDAENFKLYALFSVGGGEVGCGREDFRRFATAGWLKNYGGPPVSTRHCSETSAPASVVARIDAFTGDVLDATYIYGSRLFGSTSGVDVTHMSHTPATRSENGRLEVVAHASATPLRPDTSRMLCNVDGPFEWRLVFDEKLTTALSSNAGLGCR